MMLSSFDPGCLSQALLRVSTSALPYESKLDGVLQLISDAFHSERCILLNPEGSRKDGFLGRLLSEKSPLRVSDGSTFAADGLPSEEADLIRPAFACLPLSDRILYLGFAEKRTFSLHEVDWLTLAGQVVADLLRNHTLQLHADDALEKARKQERRARQLVTLMELNRTLLTTMNLDRILHTALTIITHGDGLRFNRAMLFLLNERKKVLEGTMAVGPDNPEEAGRVWEALSQNKGIPLDIIAHLPPSPPGGSILYSAVKGIRIPLGQKNCFLTRTILESKSFNLQFPFQDDTCDHGSECACAISERLGRSDPAYSFATVPVMGKDKIIGVVMVDNIFNQRLITEEDIQFLSLFSAKAGLVIENANLYRHLEEVHHDLKEAQDHLIHRDKMVALGEVCSSIAHEIKNPLVSIGGFARRLYRSIPAEAPEKRYTQTIIIEVARLEKILNDIAHYTDGERLPFQECNLPALIEESLSMVSEDVLHEARLIKEYAGDLPTIIGDYHQLKQTFFSLITNAYQATDNNGTIIIRAFPLSENGLRRIRVEVEDSGTGIDPKHLHDIFNPFHTTKEPGLGLGLATVHRVVTSHHGQIEVDNKPGKGVKFVITLPVEEERLDQHSVFPEQAR